MHDGDARRRARANVVEQRRADPAPESPQHFIWPLPAPAREAVAHERVQRVAGDRGIEIVPFGPFDGNVEQLAAGIAASLAEIADLTLHEIERELLQLPDLADIVVMEARFLE